MPGETIYDDNLLIANWPEVISLDLILLNRKQVDNLKIKFSLIVCRKSDLKLLQMLLIMYSLKVSFAGIVDLHITTPNDSKRISIQKIKSRPANTALKCKILQNPDLYKILSITHTSLQLPIPYKSILKP